MSFDKRRSPRIQTSGAIELRTITSGQRQQAPTRAFAGSRMGSAFGTLHMLEQHCDALLDSAADPAPLREVLVALDQRIAILTRLAAQPVWEGQARLHSLSSHGFACDVDRELREGQWLSACLSLEPEGGILFGNARVAWCRSRGGGWRCGAEFAGLARSDRMVLRRFFEQPEVRTTDTPNRRRRGAS